MIKERLQIKLSEILSSAYGLDIVPKDLLVVPTKKEFSGDYTLTVFPIAGKIKRPPAIVAAEIGAQMRERQQIKSFEVVQGFLNMTLNDEEWIDTLHHIYSTPNFGHSVPKNSTVLVEFCSPNTNKPLHLGHIRNMLLGSATARILEVAGYQVKRIQVINDRGIAICKSMLAWQKWANDATPLSTGIKGDHFVGDYYVRFEQEFNLEYQRWQSGEQGQYEFNHRKDLNQTVDDFFKEFKNNYFNKYSALGKEARDMLIRWEQHDVDTLSLWNTMNQWVFDGFNITYNKMGVQFDHTDFESITYLLGKEAVTNGLAQKIFYKKPDDSIWIDLTDVGMDQKVVLRSDGTSVYITQDLGTAQMRYDKFKMDKLIYVVANEQDYHFKVLFEILKRFKEPYASGLFHLSYGMVELPEGKMKSREGTVVDADDLIEEIEKEAKAITQARSEFNDIPVEEQDTIIHRIAMGAIKFYMLKVHPKNRMVFNPKESLDLQGQTGPYIQNAYVRIQSVLRKSVTLSYEQYKLYRDLVSEEKELIQLIETYPEVISRAAQAYEPSEIANYSYALAKAFHRFYHEVPILRSEDQATLQFRLVLCKEVGHILKDSFYLLGIDMPERM